MEEEVSPGLKASGNGLHGQLAACQALYDPEGMVDPRSPPAGCDPAYKGKSFFNRQYPTFVNKRNAQSGFITHSRGLTVTPKSFLSLFPKRKEKSPPIK